MAQSSALVPSGKAVAPVWISGEQAAPPQECRLFIQQHCCGKAVPAALHTAIQPLCSNCTSAWLQLLSVALQVARTRLLFQHRLSSRLLSYWGCRCVHPDGNSWLYWLLANSWAWSYVLLITHWHPLSIFRRKKKMLPICRSQIHQPEMGRAE